MKNLTEYVRTLKAGEDPVALCIDAQACDGYRYIHNGRTMYRVRPHPLATTAVMARLFPVRS